MSAVRSVCDVTSTVGPCLAVFSLYKRLCSRLVPPPFQGDLPLHQIPLARLKNIWQQDIKKGTLNISWIWGYRHFCGMTLMHSSEKIWLLWCKIHSFFKTQHHLLAQSRLDSNFPKETHLALAFAIRFKSLSTCPGAQGKKSSNRPFQIAQTEKWQFFLGRKLRWAYREYLSGCHFLVNK